MSLQTRDEDQQLLAEVLDLLDRDLELSEDAKYVIYAAMEGDAELATALDGTTTPGTTPPTRPRAVEVAPAAEPVGAFLKSISVRGFRGIGREAKLELHPAAGLTVVAGRNGSGKSSFSEGLELAVTGTTYRWDAKKAKTWSEHWRNLHDGTPCEVAVELAEEDAGTTKIGVRWDEGAELDAPKTWVQRPGKGRENGTASLGWAQAIAIYRPILSYDELGGLLEATPSTLFDRLDAILGLDRFIQAQKRLNTALKELQEPEKQAKAVAKTLKDDLVGVEDERAASALALLRKHSPDLDAAQALATGTTAQPPAELAALKALTQLPFPNAEDVTTVLSNLQEAHQAFVAAGTVSVEQAERRAELLQQALTFHRHQGDGKCPVCGTGDLNAAWRARAEHELATERDEITRRMQARQALETARRAAVDLIRSVPQPTAPGRPALTTVPAVRAVWQRWSELPTDHEGLTAQLAAVHGQLAVSIGAMRDEAARLLAEREDAWAPLAVRLAEWVRLAKAAADKNPIVNLGQSAAGFMVDVAKELRQARLESVEKKAREIWAALRQDSNVDLGGIELKGQGNRRHVELHATVDGTEAQALGVMSQGELHALALALFLPRATMPGSPFRFIVLDDPIQAMDPAKVDGFVRVLTELAKYRQVIVLSHDDRLPQVIRQLGLNARIVEVCRDANSVVSITDCRDPAQRYLDDAFALVKDDHMPADVRARVLPCLCRMAAEVAARDLYFASRLGAGDTRVSVETAWQNATTTASRLGLAVHGDPQADLGHWLKKAPYRKPAYDTIKRGVHQGLITDPQDAVRQVERFVQDLRAGKK